MIEMELRFTDGGTMEEGSVVIGDEPGREGNAVFSARSGDGVIHALAREMAAAGVPDQPWRAVRGEKPIMSGASIYVLAKTTVQEGERAPHLVRWRGKVGGERCPVCEQDRFVYKGCCMACLPGPVAAPSNQPPTDGEKRGSGGLTPGARPTPSDDRGPAPKCPGEARAA